MFRIATDFRREIPATLALLAISLRRFYFKCSRVERHLRNDKELGQQTFVPFQDLHFGSIRGDVDLRVEAGADHLVLAKDFERLQDLRSHFEQRGDVGFQFVVVPAALCFRVIEEEDAVFAFAREVTVSFLGYFAIHVLNSFLIVSDHSP